MKKRSCLLAALATSAVLAACGDSTSLEPDSNNSQNAGNGNTNNGVQLDRRLKQLDTSEAFYTALREALINQGGNASGNQLTAELSGAPEVAASADSDSASSSGAAGSGGTAGNNVTSTTVQEVGVDEQDRVKLSADGSRLYVLNSAYSYVGIPGIDFPAVEPVAEPLVDDLSSASISVDALSLPAPTQFETVLRIMSVDDETPDTQSLAEVALDLRSGYAEGFYLYENGAQTSAIVTSGGGGYWGYWADSTAFAGLFSDITKVNVTDPGSAAVESRFQIDGQLISSRRIDNRLFFASRYYPAIPGDQPWLQTQEQWQQTVTSTDLSTVLPQYRREGSDETTPLVNPSECFVASTGEDQLYYSPDIVTLGVIDLNTMELTDSECFLGSTETLYASPNAVFLATTQYNYEDGPLTVDGEAVDPEDAPVSDVMPWYDPRVDTDIHQFDIDQGNLVYAGTGTVPGHLGWNTTRKPFRMSERDGYLRVATMNDRQTAEDSPILLTVLQADGQGNLQVVSSLPNESRPEHIGKPGEQLYASRFLGDRAYLVTFRQTDPLYVIDLSDPADTAILGELEITGYSDYLFPLDANHLLAIGMDAVPAPDGAGDRFGGLTQGIKLSLFDVSNPAAPAELDTALLGQRGTWSPALSNHRAITLQYPQTPDQPVRVSFGANVYGDAEPAGSPSGQDAFTYYPWSYTGLHGFDVTYGPGASIVKRGAMVVEQTSSDYPWGPQFGDDRSVMVNDAVFYIHGKDVYSANWDNLSAVSPAR